MVDLNKLVGSLLNGGIAKGVAGGVAGGALVNVITSKSGLKAVQSVAQAGGLAAVGALAWNAYKKFQGNNAENVADQVVTVPQREAVASTEVWQRLPQDQFDSLASGQSTSQGLLVLRTMISAAMADGQLAPAEQKHIFDHLDNLGQQERNLLFDELRNPRSCDELAAQATDPVVAIEMYTAAALTLDMNCIMAKEFMNQLARGLNLPDSLVTAIRDNSSAGRLAIS